MENIPVVFFGNCLHIVFYSVCYLSVLTYGGECWSLNTRNEEQLQVFERRILRKIFGPICDNGKWHILYNSELYSIYTDPDIIKTIKISKLHWTYYEDAGRKSSKETYLTKTRGK